MNKKQELPSAFLRIINMDEAMRRFGDLKTLIHFIRRFVELHNGIENNAWRLYHEEDIAALGALAHKLKGAASNLSAMPLSESARQLEDAVRDNRPLRDFERLITHIAGQLEELRTAVKTL